MGTEDLADDAGVTRRRGADFRGTMLAINVASPREVAAALRSVVQAGATLVKAGRHADWGGYLGYFTDPDGHLWEITHNPAWSIGDDGRPRLT